MKTLFRIAGKYFFPVFFIFMVVLSSCSDDSNPIIPNLPPNTFCDISGSYSMAYKGQGSIFEISNPYGIMLYSFFKYSDGKIYHLGINVYFKGGTSKTGTFPIIGKKDPNIDDFAVAYFETGEGSAKQTFISESGELVLEELSLQNFKGTFNFLAKDTTGKSLTIKNGIVEIID